MNQCNATSTPMPPFFKEGERVIVDFGVGDPQTGEIVAVSDRHKTMTVRLTKGIMGEGDMPLHWCVGNEYDLLEGGRVRIQRLA